MLSMLLKQLVLPPIRQASFTKLLCKSVERVEDKIQDYLIDSNEENIHDVRTSLRRLDTSFRLFPKDVHKKPNILNLRNYYRSFFRINSEIRDLDIIRSKFTQYPQDSTSSYPNFLETLQDHRDKKLKEAKEMALAVYNSEPLRIKKAMSRRKSFGVATRRWQPNLSMK